MITKDHFKRYIDFVFSVQKTLSLKIGTFPPSALKQIQEASALNNEFRKAVPHIGTAIVRSYISKKIDIDGNYEITIVFDKR